MKKITEQKEVFSLKLQTIYDMEKELGKFLPKISKAATDIELSGILLKEIEENKGQNKRIEQVFDILEENPSKNKSEIVRGFTKDIDEMLKINSSTVLKDIMIANLLFELKHIKIANYTLATLESKKLGILQAEEILKQNLTKEQEVEKILEKFLEKHFEMEVIEM